MKDKIYYFREDLANRKPVRVSVPQKKIMMCLNENTLKPFNIIKDEIMKKLENIPLNRYFNQITQELRNKLANYLKVPENYFVFGNGADDMLYYVFIAVRENANSFAVSLSPSYFDYKTYAGSVGLGINFINLDKNFDFSVEDYLRLCQSDDCKLAILCNPNNPTGNLLNKKKIYEIIEKCSCLVLLDETYYEFSGISFVDEIDKYDNLIIIRSFSKSFSSAAIRFGYMISQPQNINEINKVMTFFHMNLITEAFAVSILDNKDIFLEHNKKVIQNRDKLFTRLNMIKGIKARNTATNFVIFSTDGKGVDLFNYLLENNIAVRPIWNHPILNQYLRVTVGNEKENELFIRTTKEFMDK